MDQTIDRARSYHPDQENLPPWYELWGNELLLFQLFYSLKISHFALAGDLLNADIGDQ